MFNFTFQEITSLRGNLSSVSAEKELLAGEVDALKLEVGIYSWKQPIQQNNRQSLHTLLKRISFFDDDQQGRMHSIVCREKRQVKKVYNCLRYRRASIGTTHCYQNYQRMTLKM